MVGDKRPRTREGEQHQLFTKTCKNKVAVSSPEGFHLAVNSLINRQNLYHVWVFKSCNQFECTGLISPVNNGMFLSIVICSKRFPNNRTTVSINGKALANKRTIYLLENTIFIYIIFSENFADILNLSSKRQRWA